MRYAYFMEHTNESGMVIQNDGIRRLHDSVRAIQDNEEIGVKYMQAWEEKIMWEQEARAKGLEEGRAKGLEEGRAEGREEARKEVREEMLLDKVRRKLDRHLSVEQIADALEESPERIQELIRKLD
ncbi:MAG: hypothetical protein LUC32_08940 [Clostridiales bacterium]|nr:hypothetical protein [Clostridiales bacterium]